MEIKLLLDIVGLLAEKLAPAFVMCAVILFYAFVLQPVLVGQPSPIMRIVANTER